MLVDNSSVSIKGLVTRREGQAQETAVLQTIFTKLHWSIQTELHERARREWM